MLLHNKTKGIKMTNREIVDKVESWNWNLNIFEIYEEVKDMDRYGYNGGSNHASD